MWNEAENSNIEQLQAIYNMKFWQELRWLLMMQRFEKRLLTKKTRKKVRENHENDNMKNDNTIFAIEPGLWEVPYCIV